MLSTLLKSLLFPKYCIGCRKIGSLLCPNCFTKIDFSYALLCPVCNKNSIDGATHPQCITRYSLDGVASGVAYRGIAKRIVYKFKYAPYLQVLQEIIDNLLYESLIQQEVAYKILEESTILVPVPLHSSKQRKRGYNHAELIARGLGEKINREVSPILVRTRATKPQFNLNREERYQNIKGAFEVREQFKEKIRRQNIILVDDVATSCATLRECANILKRAGATSVWAITFARE